MITPALAGLFLGFVLILISAISKDEKWQVAYGVIGLVFIFWSFGWFGLGRVVRSLVPALTLLFAMFSFYTKGSAQLLSIVITMVLFFQIFYI